MKDDIMFKEFFSKERNKKYLEAFVRSILGMEVKIIRVMHDIRLEQMTREEKYGVLDLEAELETGEILNIEMQLKDNHNIEERTTFYASKKIVSQIRAGNKYKEIKRVIIIAILDYKIFPYKEYITETVRVAREHKNYEINNTVKYYYIELKKFREQNPDMKKELNQWLAFLDGERGELIEMAKEENEMVKEAEREYNILTGDEALRRIEEIRLMSELEEHSALLTAKEEGEAAGLKRGESLGLKKGKRTEKREITKKLLEKGMPIDEIEEITGLKKEEIEKIKNEL